MGKKGQKFGRKQVLQLDSGKKQVTFGLGKVIIESFYQNMYSNKHTAKHTYIADNILYIYIKDTIFCMVQWYFNILILSYRI